MSFTTPYIDLVTNKMVIALVKPLVVNVHVMREKTQHIERDLADKLDRFLSGDIGTVTYLGKDRRKHALSFNLIANSDWFMCVTAPRDEAYSLTRKTTMIFATEIALRVLGILALIALVVVSGSGLVLFFFSKRYSSAIQQHQEELTGINKDLEWNIIKRKEVETYYQTLFNVVNDAILISKESRITECNQKTMEIFGFAKEAMLDKSMLDLSPLHQPDGELSKEKLRDILHASHKGEQQIFRWSFIRADGMEFPASISQKIFRLNDEELTLSSIRDISSGIFSSRPRQKDRSMCWKW